MKYQPQSTKRNLLKKEILPNTRKIIFIFIGFVIIIVGTCLNIRGAFEKDKGPSGTSEVQITPIPMQLSGWEEYTISTLCLDITQEYPEEWFFFIKETLVKLGMDIKPKQYSFPYDTVIGDIMQSIGVQVVEEGAQCTARLAIKVKGTANAGRYEGHNDLCYTGSYVSMGIILSSENQETYEGHSSGQVYKPDHIFSGSCPNQAYKAPFTESSALAITRALVDIWGPDIAKAIKRDRPGIGDIENAMVDAAKEVLDNPVDRAPAVPEAEPTTHPAE